MAFGDCAWHCRSQNMNTGTGQTPGQVLRQSCWCWSLQMHPLHCPCSFPLLWKAVCLGHCLEDSYICSGRGRMLALLWGCSFSASCFQCELRWITYFCSTLVSHLKNGNKAVAGFVHLNSEISPIDMPWTRRRCGWIEVSPLSVTAANWLLVSGLSGAWSCRDKVFRK